MRAPRSWLRISLGVAVGAVAGVAYSLVSTQLGST